MHDLVIRGGTVVDGTGAPARQADVAIDGGERGLEFGGVKVRVSERFVLEMHVDTDEGNAAGLGSVPGSVLEPVVHTARLVERARR